MVVHGSSPASEAECQPLSLTTRRRRQWKQLRGQQQAVNEAHARACHQRALALELERCLATAAAEMVFSMTKSLRKIRMSSTHVPARRRQCLADGRSTGAHPAARAACSDSASSDDEDDGGDGSDRVRRRPPSGTSSPSSSRCRSRLQEPPPRARRRRARASWPSSSLKSSHSWSILSSTSSSAAAFAAAVSGPAVFSGGCRGS